MSNDDPQSPPVQPLQPVEGPPGRLFRIRSVIAVAAAGVILGGIGGAAVTHLLDGGHGADSSAVDGDRHGDEHFPGVPPGGQLPPATVPQGGTEEDPPESDDSGENS